MATAGRWFALGLGRLGTAATKEGCEWVLRLVIIIVKIVVIIVAKVDGSGEFLILVHSPGDIGLLDDAQSGRHDEVQHQTTRHGERENRPVSYTHLTLPTTPYV